MTLTRTILAGCAAMLAVGRGEIAAAQTAGVYTGTQANGASITITVGTDSVNSLPEIIAFGLGVVGSCTGNITVNTGVGVGAAQDIVADKATVIFNGDQYYFKAAVVFDPGTNSFGGKITAYTVIFVPPVSGHPTKAAFCHTGTQTFTASPGAAAALALPPGMTIH